MDRLHVIYMVAQDLVARALKDVMAGTLVVPGYQEPVAPPPAAPPAPPPPDADDASDAHAETRHVASLLERAERVIVMAGAGLSTAAGIPDFRTPGTGLYYQLEKYELPNPEAVFSIDYFRQRPEAFHMLAHEMWPGKFAPTDAHAFIRLLADKGKLLRCYTQNIDGLERLAGVPAELLMECHGTFATARAIDPPKAAVDIGWYKAQLDAGCTQIRCPETGSLVKPVRRPARRGAAPPPRTPSARCAVDRSPVRSPPPARAPVIRAARALKRCASLSSAHACRRTLSSSASRCRRASVRA
jgi:hypothetical protein